MTDTTRPRPVHLVIMGVSGSGKTTIAEQLEQRTGVPYAEADAFHPEANKKKMGSGQPLDDDDRWPWLHELRDWMTSQAEQGHSTIVTCSALKKSYRDVLRAAEGDEFFVLLDAPEDVLAARMEDRKGHFMPASLLRSQLDTLEGLDADENGVTVDATEPPESLAREILSIGALTVLLHE
ncbi:gluconokinase [Corynebacterium kalidii]|uniref:Gluconokinase n=1 Tax=Corynebacterium kalidii TaxID=2931982 RepID=A0A9X1WEM3_9CORY|nr:gluconokinase [Corynebacterium kalidii]MCJ7857589.1 gluconokinase [Corynebacterium kalidii]